MNWIIIAITADFMPNLSRQLIFAFNNLFVLCGLQFSFSKYVASISMQPEDVYTYEEHVLAISISFTSHQWWCLDISTLVILSSQRVLRIRLRTILNYTMNIMLHGKGNG